MILRTTFLISLISLTPLATTPAQSPPNLEGTHWTVEVKPDKVAKEKGEKHFKDTFIFENKKVRMTECEKMGFGASDYTVQKPEDKPKGKDDKGGDKPGEKPADKGGEKSGEKPADKGGDKPADKGAKAAANAWAFKTEQRSDKEGKSVWHAEISGDAIKGTLVWTKKDGTELHYTFEGHKDPAKKDDKKKEEPKKEDPKKGK